MDAFAVLAEPTRRRILDVLREGERSVTDLTGLLGISQPTVSKHLRVLRDARMVAATVYAQHRQYRLESAALAEIDAWLAPYRRLWEQRLDALEEYLDKGEDV
jgi:DNA-binding transcriptional ArsR family regulator